VIAELGEYQPRYSINCVLKLLENLFNYCQLHIKLIKISTTSEISELPSDYVLEFGSSDSSSYGGTTEYVLLTNREIPSMKEV
jgi:hypothetical protein